MKSTCLCLFLGLASSLSFGQERCRVACVGNSITFGMGINNREENSYPAQLQTYLGDCYEVQNFGVNSTTALSNGDYPYITTPQYKASLEFEPNIVFLKLGTNDSKANNIQKIDNFISSCQAIIDSYKALKNNPRIILITPVRCYFDDETQISNSRIVNIISPLVRELAYTNNLEIFDGYSLFGVNYDSSLLPDQLHPSSRGAGIIAQNLYRLVSYSKDEKFDIFNELTTGSELNFYGFKGAEFNDGGINFKVIQPKYSNSKHSWILRVRGFGETPQLDCKLLELGFHIAYCKVDKATSESQLWNNLFKKLTQAGLNSTPLIEYSNNGELVVMEYSKENLNRAIEFDGDTRRALNEGIGFFASAESTPESILKFVLKSEDVCENLAAKPLRGNEFRSSGAGWLKNADWNQVARDITATLKSEKVDILMLGNSITQGFAYSRKLVGSCSTNSELTQIFGDYTWESAGISGDRTSHLLWRIENGEYNSCHPKYVTIAIGVNNTGDDAQSVYEGIMAITEAALKEFSDSKIILFGMLPTGASQDRNQIFCSIIELLHNTSFDERVKFVDPCDNFANSERWPIAKLYNDDLIHLSQEGYSEWAKLIVETINEW